MTMYVYCFMKLSLKKLYLLTVALSICISILKKKQATHY